jgi:hypothetical protein
MPAFFQHPAVLWITLGFVLLVGVLGYFGFLMASSFTVSNPEQIDHWRRMAYAYLALTGICVLLAVAVGVALFRRLKASSPDKIPGRTT